MKGFEEVIKKFPRCAEGYALYAQVSINTFLRTAFVNWVPVWNCASLIAVSVGAAVLFVLLSVKAHGMVLNPKLRRQRSSGQAFLSCF